jgi:hypothetical protein
MRKLVRLILVIAGTGLVIVWWVVLGHIMKSPSVWVDMGQWLGECVLFLVALLFIMAGLLFGANASTHQPKRPAQRAAEPMPVYRCEVCESKQATLYNLKTDRLCCDSCAFAGNAAATDITSITYGIHVRRERDLTRRG